MMTFKILYNLLMRDVEPELCTDVLPTLDEKHKDETPQERTKRFARYADAWKVAEGRLQTLREAWGARSGSIRQQLRERSDNLDLKGLQQILSQIKDQ